MKIKLINILCICLLLSCPLFSKEKIKKEETLNETWTEPNGSRIAWYSENFISFMDTNPERTYSAFGGETYIYQPETGEIFVQISDMDVKQQISDTVEHEVPLKRYFSIVEMNDSTVVVHINVVRIRNRE